jgi:hypothetical protein
MSLDTQLPQDGEAQQNREPTCDWQPDRSHREPGRREPNSFRNRCCYPLLDGAQVWPQ